MANLRNPTEPAIHSENTTTGTKPASPTDTPRRAESFLNTCKAEAEREKINQATTSPVVSLAYLAFVISTLLISQLRWLLDWSIGGARSMVRFPVAGAGEPGPFPRWEWRAAIARGRQGTG